MPLSYALAFAMATAVAALLTPLMQWVSLRVGAVSIPGGRNVNAMRMPRLGGPALFLAAALPMVVLFNLDGVVSRAVRSDGLRAVGFGAGALLMLIVGAWDDIRSLRARTKLLAQAVAALIAWGTQLRLDVVELPYFGALHLGVFALPLTVVWIVGVTNAINLIDGLDGLAAGVVLFAAVTNFVVAFMNGSFLVAAVMICLVGALLGFLFFNFNPARIFMGDSGSYFLGYVMAVTAIAAPFQKASTAVSLLTPIIALGVPITDTLFAMLRRILERRSIFSPDRGHIHHRLLDMGLTHRRAVFAIYAASAILCVGAIAGSIKRDVQVGFALAVLSALIFGVVRVMARPRPKSVLPPQAERLRRLLPLLPERLNALSTEAQIFSELQKLVDEVELERCELIAVESGKERLAQVFLPTMVQPGGIAATVRVSLGAERGAKTDIRFVWFDATASSYAVCAPLFMIVADQVEQSLRRVGSSYI